MKYKKGDCFKSISYNSDGTGEGDVVVEIKDRSILVIKAYFIGYIKVPFYTKNLRPPININGDNSGWVTEEWLDEHYTKIEIMTKTAVEIELSKATKENRALIEQVKSLELANIEIEADRKEMFGKCSLLSKTNKLLNKDVNYWFDARDICVKENKKLKKKLKKAEKKLAKQTKWNPEDYKWRYNQVGNILVVTDESKQYEKKD